VANPLKPIEKHIAVFGGSGSGKTVLVSSFYGAAETQSENDDVLYHLTADDTGQGNELRANYLGMKKRGKVPEATKFAATTFTFTARIKEPGGGRKAKHGLFNALRLVWHDYPGEWFEEEPSSNKEKERRLETFRNLLQSDVALIMIDGQKLLENTGQEEKYLKLVFGNLKDGILRLKEQLLTDGKPLTRFPRIWIIALSKADLHPELNAREFKDLVVEKAARDITKLHKVLKELVKQPEALSVGEDFLLLSSAKFEPDQINVEQRIGVDLLLPIAFMLSLTRLVQWQNRIAIPRRMLLI